MTNQLTVNNCALNVEDVGSTPTCLTILRISAQTKRAVSSIIPDTIEI